MDPYERMALMALAALHREYGPESLFHSDAVAMVAGRPLVVELDTLRNRGMADLMRGDNGVLGYRLTGEGFAALPASEEKRALTEDRERADQELKEEQ